MLRIRDLQFTGLARPRVAQVVERPLGRPQPRCPLSTPRTAAPAVIAGPAHDLRRGKIFHPLDAFGGITNIASRAIHNRISQNLFLGDIGYPGSRRRENSLQRRYRLCFYAVSALLLTRNISTSKHGYLRALLHQDYVKPGQISEQMGKHFDLLFDSRHEGDYEDFVCFEAENVRPLLEPTKSFVDQIADLIRHEIQGDVS